MKLGVVNTSGKSTGKEVELADAVFGVDPNDHAIYLDVKQHRAAVRQGTHDSRERSDVRGSRRKIKRQKGTGTARAGDIQNPLFRGGGRIFGPHPRDYYFKLNKKVKGVARKSALSYKAKGEGIVVVEDFTMNGPKTKELVDILNNLGAGDKKALVVLPASDRNVFLSGRNLKKAKVTAANRLSTYDIMNAQTLILAESSVNLINEALS